MRGIAALVAGLAMVFMLPSSPATAGGEAIVTGTISARATFEHIGLVWDVSGDTDLDSSMSIEYRQVGTVEWHPGAPAVRAYPGLIVNGEPLGLDSWGASAMWLTPGVTYEIRATISDPDGGSTVSTIAATTRVKPVPGPTTHHVAPGTGGGSGTAADPYRGLQAAADAASPGDTFRGASASTSSPSSRSTPRTSSASSR